LLVPTYYQPVTIASCGKPGEAHGVEMAAKGASGGGCVATLRRLRGAESSRCLGEDRKGEGVLELEPEKKKMERAAVVIMSETVPINVMLWPPAAIAFP